MLWSGYIHSKPYQVMKDGKHSSSVHYVVSWPKSTRSTVTFTTTSAITSGFLKKFARGSKVNIFHGDTEVDLQVQDQYNLALSFSDGIAETSPNPRLFHQLDNNEAQWNFQYSKSSDVSYSLDTYYLFQVGHDSLGFAQGSFGFSVKIVLTCVAWEKYPWRQERNTVFDDPNDGYGI